MGVRAVGERPERAVYDRMRVIGANVRAALETLGARYGEFEAAIVEDDARPERLFDADDYAWLDETLVEAEAALVQLLDAGRARRADLAGRIAAAGGA